MIFPFLNGQVGENPHTCVWHFNLKCALRGIFTESKEWLALTSRISRQGCFSYERVRRHHLGAEDSCCTAQTIADRARGASRVPRSVVMSTAAKKVSGEDIIYCSSLGFQCSDNGWCIVLVRVCCFSVVIEITSGLTSLMLNIALKDRKNAPTSNPCGHMTRSEDPQLYLIPCVL